MTIAEQTAKLIETMPPDKAETVLEFARLVAEQADSDEWDRRLDTAHKLPKFRAFVEQARRGIAEGNGKPLNLDDL